MIVNPRIGSEVQIWYGPRRRDTAPHHGKVGTVAIASHGKPRNHGILVDGLLVVVPCGNIRKVAP